MTTSDSGADQPVQVELARYVGTWEDDDPDAGFKREVAERTRLDPLPTFEQLSTVTGVPVGALLRYALVRWAAEGSEALLAVGPATVERLWAVVAAAEESGTDEARLDAYRQLCGMLAWLRAPLDAGEARPPGAAGR